MGAMAPPPHWTPIDDILLKAAVECGASLEALAKGAVPFSRRYTIQELQERWSSLLYDPVISEEASANMAELDRLHTNPSRSNKLESIKELLGISGKRKSESMRKCYYARRKRICNEPFGMMGVNLLSRPGHSILEDANELPPADCGIGDPISNDLGIQGPDFDIGHHSFSEFGPNAAESISPFSTAKNHVHELQFGGKTLSNNLSYPFDENLSPTGDSSVVPGFDQPKHVPLSNVFETEGMENKGNPCLEFGDASFDSFGCSSPLPQMPVWSTSPGIAATNLPIQSGENDQQARDAFLMPPVVNANDAEAFTCDGAGPSSDLRGPLSCDGISTEDYFAELSNTLFDFSNEDELLFMDNGKEPIDKSYLDGLSSLLLDSPNRGELPDANPDEVVGTADGQFVQTSAHCGVLDSTEVHVGYEPKLPDAQVAASVSTAKALGPEYRNGVICCVLNTEDPEIPSNDDVFLPFRFPSPSNSSGMSWRLQDTSYLVSSSPTDFLSTRKANVGPSMVQNNQKGLGRSSCVMEPSQSLDKGLKGLTANQGVKFELPKSSIHHAAVRNARNREFPNHISSANAAANNAIGVGIRGIDREMDRGKGLDYKSSGTFLDKYSPGRDILQILQNNASSSRSEMDVKPEIPKDGPSNIDLTCQNATIQNPIDKPLVSDQDEQWSENDFDVPDFSDVEAMILDMDLSPNEYDIFTSSDVQRYQQEETKRTIIRLEQAANACTQRAIAAQGAFAVLYGRYSKYYIKKPEVLLGRATEDIVVDIDLGREKYGGKISRKQATLKMDAHGTFHLKNLGKCSIYVNGRDVPSGEIASLNSGCLIQIRTLTYVFETNHALVKQYVDSFGEGGNVSSDHKPFQKS